MEMLKVNKLLLFISVVVATLFAVKTAIAEFESMGWELA